MRLPLFFLAVTVVAPFAARATPNFPAAISRDLQLSAPPACTICHATNEGGTGTVVKPFGKYLVSRGLAPFDESSLAGSLAAARGEHHDTDGDGLSDLDALQRGLDPNGSPSSGPLVEDPSFGCSATGGGAGNTLILALVVGLRLAAAHVCRLRGLVRSPAERDGTNELEGGGSSSVPPCLDARRVKAPVPRHRSR